ncbi:MAG: hypothetical protein QM621_03010 [Aeromicrobium sp.]|uniref:hypothetical protein n=1 Tax=Aeromicrobium sp. TaxID=1871063 RepID=UPI0039E61371
MTGLQDFTDLAEARKGATFTRRFATAILEPISDADLRTALHPFVREDYQAEDSDHHVQMAPDAADLIVRLCCGEPFLFRLVGYQAWNAGSGDVITTDDVRRGRATARPEASMHLERVDLAGDLASRLVFCGDYVDRGPESAGVLQRIREKQHAHPGRVDAVVADVARRSYDPATHPGRPTPLCVPRSSPVTEI